MKFNEWLKEHRNQANLTQDELGQRINVVRQTISMYEKGKRIPDNETVVKLARVFNVEETEISNLLEDVSVKKDLSIKGDKKNNGLLEQYLIALLQLVIILGHFVFIKRFNSIDFWRSGIRETFYRFFMVLIVPCLLVMFGRQLGRTLHTYNNRLLSISGKNYAFIKYVCLLLCFFIFCGYIGVIDYSFEFYRFKWMYAIIEFIFIKNWLLLDALIVVCFGLGSFH